MALLEKGNIWPTESHKKKHLPVNCWLDLVKPRKVIGTPKASAKETIHASDHVNCLFDVLCATEEQQDYDELWVEEGITNNVSAVSCTMCSVTSLPDEPTVNNQTI